MTTTQQDIYITKDGQGRVEIWDAEPVRDTEGGFWLPAPSSDNSREADGSPVYGLLLPWIKKASWDGSPVRVRLTAEG